jgi:hypothetical protein
MANIAAQPAAQLFCMDSRYFKHEIDHGLFCGNAENHKALSCFSWPFMIDMFFSIMKGCAGYEVSWEGF